MFIICYLKNIFSLQSLRIDSTDKKRVLVLGLDKAGKSTFVSALCGRQVQVDYAPTQGFAVVTTTIGNKALNFWEGKCYFS